VEPNLLQRRDTARVLLTNYVHDFELNCLGKLTIWVAWTQKLPVCAYDSALEILRSEIREEFVRDTPCNTP
jgi:hypothetical protein